MRIEGRYKGHVLLGKREWQVSGESVWVWVGVSVCAGGGRGSCISHSKETHKTGDNCRNSKLREAGQ